MAVCRGPAGFFDTYILLANTNTITTTATLTFLLEGGTSVVRSYALAPKSRSDVYAGTIPELTGASFAILVTAPLPIVAERAMYFGSRLFEGGHASAGALEPSTTWIHAEGATGPYFDTYILVGNPAYTPANLTLAYLTGGGTRIVRHHVVPARGRLTLHVDEEAPALADAAVSTTISSDVPVVSERSTYWNGDAHTWIGAHNSMGVPATATRWALAEGRVGGARAYESYVLIVNPTVWSAQVRATFLRTDGTAVVKMYDVPPTSRFNVWVNVMVPELMHEDFAALIEVLNGVGVAVERSMYWTAEGVTFGGGSCATAVPLP